LDIGLATKVFARPHHEESANGTTSAEDTIGGRDGGGCNTVIARFTLGGKAEVSIPSWLADSTGDNRSTVAIGLVEALESPS
jgi:hypothetical protein